jgi:hypothetical protein
LPHKLRSNTPKVTEAPNRHKRDWERRKGNVNRATLAVAWKLVAYLVAVDRRKKEFLVIERENRTAA